ncbi:hypothetical protein DVH05_027724 [Phytophthora capsici]|nr:hypothetical protein DVH05_027724 [Phytophthora capsici]
MDFSPQDCKRCQDLTQQLLEKTLDDCEELEFDGEHATLDKKRWKRLQTQENVTIYADRTANSAWLPVMNRDEWEYPVAVTALGRMECSLDDLLFALMTPTTASQRLRSFLMDRRPEKNCQLVPIVTPTQESPFQFQALSRFVCTQNWPFTMFKGPREMVLAIGTGKFTTPSGKLYGYEMVQSVSLRSHSQMPRSRVLQARVFWGQPDGSISVYNKLIVDAKSRLSDSVKQLMLCRAVVGFWKFVPRSLETKKLWWCLKNKKTLILNLQEESTGCAVQSQPHKQSVSNRCEFCDTFLCGGSKCRTSCQLKLVLSGETGFLEQRLTLCPRCALFVRSRDSAEIARAALVDTEQSSFGSLSSFTKTYSTTGDEDSFSSASTESNLMKLGD